MSIFLFALKLKYTCFDKRILKKNNFNLENVTVICLKRKFKTIKYVFVLKLE